MNIYYMLEFCVIVNAKYVHMEQDVMARSPKTAKEGSETKSEHLHILISPSEVKAIDDWGFKNRIRTKAESVRRLCQIGLAFSEEQAALFKRTERALRATTLVVKDFQKDRPSQGPELRKVRRRVAAGLLVAIEEQLEAFRAMTEVRKELIIMTAKGDVEQLIQLAEQLKGTLRLEAEASETS